MTPIQKTTVINWTKIGIFLGIVVSGFAIRNDILNAVQKNKTDADANKEAIIKQATDAANHITERNAYRAALERFQDSVRHGYYCKKR